MNKEETTTFKITTPLFKENELENFDNHINEIVKEYTNILLDKKEQILTQRIIQNLQQRIDKAIELINNKTYSCDECTNVIAGEDLDELYSILKGENNE